MKLSLSLAVGVGLVLSGCVLDGKQKPPQKQNTSFAGSVSLTDISTVAQDGGMAYQANIAAKFQADPNILPAERRRLPFSVTRQDRGFKCQLITRQIREEKAADKWVPVSVGKLVLGTMTSSKEIEIGEDESHSYYKELLPRFAPGLYFIASEGKKPFRPFQVEFSMPEEIRSVRVNEHGLEEGPAIVQKSTPLSVEWDSATAPNDMNIIEMYLITQQGEEQRMLACGALESNLTVEGGKVRVEVAAPQMSGLFATPDAAFELLRVNEISGSLTNGPSLRLDGIRAWAWPSLVAE